jgi:hypothetical protein
VSPSRDVKAAQEQLTLWQTKSAALNSWAASDASSDSRSGAVAADLFRLGPYWLLAPGY